MVYYLLLGLIGLPLFTGGGGPQYIFSPTFGFLLSFPLSAMVVGLILGPVKAGGSGMVRKLGAMIAGSLVVYAIGIPWLGLNLLLVQGKAVGPGALLMMGAVPFLPGDLLKSVLAALLTGPVRRVMDQVRRH
jgi:biotin transport system substrate-specific component